MFRVCHVFLSVCCSLVVTCWERADFLVFYCVYVTFPCGTLGQVQCLIVPISDLTFVEIHAFSIDPEHLRFRFLDDSVSLRTQSDFIHKFVCPA